MIDYFAQCVSIFAAAVAILIALRCWRASIVEWSRDAAFTLRNDLFLFAARRQALDDPEYRATRDSINGYLRIAHLLGSLGMIIVVLRALCRGRRTHLAIVSKDNTLHEECAKATRQLVRVVRARIIYTNPIGFVILRLIDVLAFTRHDRSDNSESIDNSIGQDLKRAGSDDEYARVLIGAGHAILR